MKKDFIDKFKENDESTIDQAKKILLFVAFPNICFHLFEKLMKSSAIGIIVFDFTVGDNFYEPINKSIECSTSSMQYVF